MPELIRLWHLFRPYRGWMLGGFAVALVTLLANVTLMAISGWFITAMAVAGAAGVAMNYFTPAAIIRGSAIARTAGRYFERLITHEATLRQLAGLRVWFYRHLEPLAPARLMEYHSADLLTRIRADIDALDNLYVRVMVPVLVAITAGLAFFAFTALFDLGLALLLLSTLLIAGVALPWAGHRLGKQPGRRIVEIQAELRQTSIDGTQGLSELLIYGAADSHARHMDALSRALVAEQERMSQLTGIAQAATGLTANLTLWGMLWLGIPLVQDGSLAPPQLAMLALFSLATFEAVAPLPMAFQQLESTLTAARRLFAIVDTEPAVPEPTGPAPQPKDSGLSIQGLRFRYPGKGAGQGLGSNLSAGAGSASGFGSSMSLILALILVPVLILAPVLAPVLAWRLTASISSCHQAGGLPSSAPPAPARPRCSTCCCASGRQRPAPSASAACRWRRSRARISAAASPWSHSTPICSIPASARTC